MQRRTTDKVDKENKSTISRNTFRVPTTTVKPVKNEVGTNKGRVIEKPTVATVQSSAVKPVSEIKKPQVSKPVTTDVSAVVKGKIFNKNFDGQYDQCC